MPKQTYYNLPEQKRQNIEEAALDEFAEFGYDASNMNRIVAQSGIAKGSFYQYFSDKKDLYFHLAELIFSAKAAQLAPVLEDCRAHSFSYNLEKLIRLELTYFLGDPRLHSLIKDFDALQPALTRQYTGGGKQASADIYAGLLLCAEEKDELTEFLNIDYAALFISALVEKLTLYLMDRLALAAEREAAVRELLLFIERAVLR